MSKAVLISIRPQWCELISSGKKTIEVRKTRPEIETPFKCYIYCTKEHTADDRLWIFGKKARKQFGTSVNIAHLCGAKDVGGAYKGNGKVIGEFVCDEIIDGRAGPQHWIYICENSMLSCQQIYSYCGEDADGNTKYCWGWHISDLVIYDEPKKLQEFYGYCNGYCGSYCKWYSQCSISEYSCALNCRPPQSWRYLEV